MIQVGALSLTRHQGIPVSHGGDAQRGLTARRWPVKALVTPAEWLTLDGIYQTWRTARLADPDTMVSLAVGSTVATSGRVWGMTWTNVAAWFSSAPTPDPAGSWVSVSFELVDAAQQLAVMLRESELTVQVADNESTYGTYQLGNLTLNLTANADGFDDGPTVELTGAGVHVIRGALAASAVKRIQGWTHAAGAGATARSWYASQIASTPSPGAWWPTSPPQIEQRPVIVAGARVTRTTVTIDLKQIR